MKQGRFNIYPDKKKGVIMAYIAPNSTVEFFGDIGLSPNYENTLYFASVQAKDNYFDGVPKITTATALSYNRAERGFFKVEKPMSQLINAGYIRFKNTSFENKWFYAFVRSVEYINNITTQVNFELDVMMTWMGVFQLNECFVERQHTVGDAIGANICAEGLPLGNYVTENQLSYGGGDYVIVLFKSWRANDGEGDNPEPEPPVRITQGTYIPLYTVAYTLDETGLASLNNKLNQLTTDNRIDEVLAIKLVPERWVTTGSGVPTYTMNVPKPYSQIGGSTYTPRNKKLFTYPYKYLEVDNSEGEKAAYKYEYFNTIPDTESSGNCTFTIHGSGATPEPSVLCVPDSYNHEAHAYGDSISMNNFPSLCWNVDAYKAYIAQRDSTLFGNQVAPLVGGALLGAVQGAVKAGVSTASIPGAIGGAIGGALLGSANAAMANFASGANGQLLSDTLNELRSGDQPARMPNETRGTISSNIMVQTRHKAFYFRMKSITKNYAMMIDDFFDMYGYAIRQVQTPNMHARPNWTYVKTLGCSLKGSLPADDAAAIESIFDKGVRFWYNHNNIGNYNLNNRPT